MFSRKSVRDPSAARRGTVAVMVAVSLMPVLGVLALVLDGGFQLAEQRRAQAAADATAHAAAVSLAANYANDAGSDPHGTAKSAALAIASANGMANDGVTSTVTLNIPPSSSLTIFAGNAGYAEAIVAIKTPRLLSAIWGQGTLTASAHATARATSTSVAQPAVILLDPSASGALSVAGSARVVTSGTIQVNSSSTTAVIATNTGYAKGSAIQITGNYTTNSSGYLSGTVTTGAATVADPLSSLAAPSTTGLTVQPAVPSYGSFTINPGIYNGGVTFGGGSTVTMNPGTYYMKGGGFNVANGVTVSGSGVFIYEDHSASNPSLDGALSFQGGGVINLTPPTSGTYSGISYYQDRSNTKAISIANGTTNTLTGKFYAAGAAVSFAGGSQSSQYGSQFVAKSMNLSNNAYVGVSGTGTGGTPHYAIAIVE